MGHGQIEHRIPEKFEAFIVITAETAMREGLLQQSGFAKGVAQADLQGSESIRCGHVDKGGVQSKLPMRLKLLKFIQTKNALPTMFWSGTNPQKRESSELSRLSPIMK